MLFSKIMNPEKMQIYFMSSLYTHINKGDETTILDIILRTNKIFLPKQVNFHTVSLYSYFKTYPTRKKINILKFF